MKASCVSDNNAANINGIAIRANEVNHGSLVVMVQHPTINHTPFSVRERMLTTTLATMGLCHLVYSAALFIMFTNTLWNVFSGVMSRGIIVRD